MKSAKLHLKKIMGDHVLTFNELSTVVTQVESCLNSRPLGAYDSHSPDGSYCITPGHFLVGRPMMAYPDTPLPDNTSLYRRWTLCQAILQQYWHKWSKEYLQQLQTAGKWHKVKPNLQVGDLVLMADGSSFHTQWTLARVTETYAGKDGLVRVVDVRTTSGATYRRPITKLSKLMTCEAEDMDDSSNRPDLGSGCSSPPEDVQASLISGEH